MALAADEGAAAVTAAMGGASRSAGDLRDAFGLTAGAAGVMAGRANDLRDALALTEGAADAAARAVAGAGLVITVAAASAGELNDRLNDIAGSAGDARTALMRTTTAVGGLTRSLGNLDIRIPEVIVSLVALDDELDKKVAAFTGTAAGAAALSAMMTILSARATATAASTAAAGRGIRIWGTGIRLTGAAIHWLIAGTSEFLAVAIPALIAGAAGAFVLFQGVAEQVGVRMQALYTTTEATAALLHRTTGDVLGLGHAWQTAQDAANPLAWELLGAYINGAKTAMHGLAGAGLQVDQIFTRFAAKLDVDMRQGATQIAGLLSHMVPDLVEFGQIFGNLGHAVLNFASDMPGLAEVLLGVADAISTVIRWISELPHWMVLSFMAFEEFIRWGGLLAGWIAPLVMRLGMLAGALGAGGLQIALTNASTGLMTFSGVARGFFGLIGNIIRQLALWGAVIVTTIRDFGLLRGAMILLGAITPFGWVMIGVAALAALGIWLGRTRTSAENLADTLDKRLADASSVNTIAVATDNIRQLDQALSQTGQTAGNALSMISGGLTGMGSRTRSAGASWAFLGQTIAGALSFNIGATPLGRLTDSLKLQQTAIGMTLSGAAKLSRVYGTSFAQSVALADAAGVKLGSTEIILGKNANVAGQQVENLVTGYQRMDQVGGTLGADLNVLAIQSGLANTQVGKLNQGWDQFISNATSITSSFASLNEGVQNMGHVVADTANHLAGITGGATLTVKQFALAMRSYTGVGAQVWSNFDQGVSSAQQFMDALRTATAYGGVQMGQFKGAVANAVAEMLPFASHSQTATSILSALAQEAGGPATGNFQTLKQWVDSNKVSAKEFGDIMQQLTGQMSNAGAAAKEFASTLQSSMQQEIANALLGTEHLNQTVGQFSKAVQANGGTISAQSPAYKAMFDFLTSSGFTAAQATAQLKLMTGQIDGTAGAASHSTGPLGAMRGAIGGVGNEAATAAAAVRAVALAIDALHSKTITVDVLTEGAGLSLAGGGGRRITGNAKGTGPGGAERGLSLVGEEGPELMWMRGGEHVLPAGPTKALMHAAGGAHGYAGGTSTFDKLLHLLERDFRLIENGLRVNLKRPQGVWFPSIIKLVEEIRRDFAKHLITQQQELALLKQAETRNKRLEGIAVHHAESKDLTALANLFAPRHHAPHLLGPIAALLAQVQKAHGAGVIGKGEETRLTRLLKHDNAKLLNLEHDRSKILTALKNAEAHYLAEVKAERQYAASVTSSAESSASLSTILGGATGPVSSSYLLASMRMDLSTITRFDSDIKKLEKLGLDKNLLNQIIQLGPAQGDPVAQALINGPLSNIKAMDATESHITAASKRLGQSTSKEMFAAGIDAARGLVKGIEQQEKAIDKVMEKVARDMARTLRRELKAHSPSGVTREIGRDVIDDIPLGIADRLPSLDSSLRTAAGHVSSALGSAAGVRGPGGGSTEITVPVTVMLDGKVLTRSVQTLSLRTDRRNGANNLSLRRGRGG